ncbi:hypothetical protein KAV79_01770 [Candidatus Aerophobetes bacterium]|nr:hypothetical protein [Candidatus Aerophobetes bacterium]
MNNEEIIHILPVYSSLICPTKGIQSTTGPSTDTTKYVTEQKLSLLARFFARDEIHR